MATNPYLIANEPNVRIEVIARTGDVLDPGTGYVYGGIPDGLGVIDNGDGTITILNNHEYGSSAGLVHDHGSTGAYISRIVVDKATLQVLTADDAIQSYMSYDETTDSWVAGTTAFNRFCSADLAAPDAFRFGDLGTDARIYLTGEESGPAGRAIGLVATGDDQGTAYELDFLGNLSFENVVASPFAQEKTIVVTTDDSTPGQVYVYIGEKQASGNDVEKAGLVGGSLFGIAVEGVQNEQNGLITSGARFSLAALGDVSDLSGAEIDAASDAAGITEFLRPEDAAFDPSNPNVLYFTTTSSPSRVIKVTFDDITDPEAGGVVEVVVDPSDGVASLDNIAVGADGKVYIQEDPGNNPRLAKVWVYDPADDSVTQLAEHNPLYFDPVTGLYGQDEESSGIIDVTSILGDANTKAFLLDVQAHANSLADPALVEDGQLIAMFVDDPFLVGTNSADDLFGSAADETLIGKNGDDTAFAGSGNDEINGGNGNDELHGGRGDDIVKGANGKDILFGDEGDDILLGGTGKDIFVFDNTGDSGDDVIKDFSNLDRILLTERLDNDEANVALDGGVLELAGGGSVDVGVAALHYAGEVEIGGVTYYSYEAANGSGKVGYAGINGLLDELHDFGQQFSGLFGGLAGTFGLHHDVV